MNKNIYIHTPPAPGGFLEPPQKPSGRWWCIHTRPRKTSRKSRPRDPKHYRASRSGPQIGGTSWLCLGDRVYWGRPGAGEKPVGHDSRQ